MARYGRAQPPKPHLASPVVAASSYTFAGPTSGTVNVASTNFTVTPNGTSTATVTPATTGAGTFTPSAVTFSGTTPQTFTYTPTSTAGSPHTLSVTNGGGLANPASVAYTVAAAAANFRRTLSGLGTRTGSRQTAGV